MTMIIDKIYSSVDRLACYDLLIVTVLCYKINNYLGTLPNWIADLTNDTCSSPSTGTLFNFNYRVYHCLSICSIHLQYNNSACHFSDTSCMFVLHTRICQWMLLL